MQGKPTLTYSRDGLPEYDYAVTVTRANAPDRYEIYTATLQAAAEVQVPLAADDRDALLDLQAAFARAYDLGNFATLINYRDRAAAGRAAGRRPQEVARRHAAAGEAAVRAVAVGWRRFAEA